MSKTRRKAGSSEAETPRRRWNGAKKRRIVAESYRGGESATAVARRNGAHVSLLFKLEVTIRTGSISHSIRSIQDDICGCIDGKACIQPGVNGIGIAPTNTSILDACHAQHEAGA